MVNIQSFWSKPFLNADSNDFNYRVSGGFVDKRYFYYCWVLSFLSLKNLGRKCLLVTDDAGKYLLAEALALEYDEVRLELNAFKNLSSSYWAIPKLHVYKTINEPFLHFDGDLILYTGFQDLDLDNRDLVFEFRNDFISDDHLKSIKYLDSLIFDVKYQTDSIPDALCEKESFFEETNDNYLCTSQAKPYPTNTYEPSTRGFLNGKVPNYEIGELNCGVIGGKDYKFLNEFASWSLDVFNENLGKLDSEFLKYNKKFHQLLFRTISSIQVYMSERKRVQLHL